MFDRVDWGKDRVRFYEDGIDIIDVGVVATVELSELELDGDNSGFVINGVSSSDQSGRSVSAAGDVNGDGFDDLIVGAFGDDPNGFSSGASFVVFGGDFSGAATQVGTVGDDTLITLDANDSILLENFDFADLNADDVILV